MLQSTHGLSLVRYQTRAQLKDVVKESELRHDLSSFALHDAEKPVPCPLSQLALTIIRFSGTNKQSDDLKRYYWA